MEMNSHREAEVQKHIPTLYPLKVTHFPIWDPLRLANPHFTQMLCRLGQSLISLKLVYSKINTDFIILELRKYKEKPQHKHRFYGQGMRPKSTRYENTYFKFYKRTLKNYSGFPSVHHSL